MTDLSARLAGLSPEKFAALRESVRRQKTHNEAITRATRPEAIPLSYAQERLWFLEQLEPNTPLYNIAATHRFKTAPNVRALEDALGEVVRRHEALRTTFELSGGQPVQVIHPPAPFKLEVTAVPGLDAAGREAEARRLALRDAREPFDLWRGPLLRARLLRLAEDEHILLVVMHHIVSDGWSMGVLFKELDALYAAFAAGRPSPLQELPIQYADFALWQRGHLRGEVLERHLTYWREQLRGAPPVSGLPSDRPRPAVQSFRGAVEGFALGRGLTESLKAVARREGATLFMTLLAGFQALVARYTGRGDVVVGTPIANRNRAELEGLIGFFVNTLVLRARVGDDPSFAELLGRVRRTTLEAYAHQDVPFEKLVEELGPERDLSHNPLFQVMFILQNAPGAGEAGGAEAAAPPPSGEGEIGEVGTSKFDLTLAVEEAGGGLAGAAEYNTDLLDGETVRRMVSHWRRLLEGAAADPGERISRLPLMGEEESRQVVVGWNRTEAEYRRGACVHELFEEQARQTPDGTALTFGGGQLSYGELDARADRLAAHLRTRGVGPEVLVGICMNRSPEMVVAVLGVLKAGGAYVPVDPAYPEERRRYMLEDAGVAVTLGEAEVAEALAREDDAAAVAVGGGASPGNLAYVIYTSGSTGRPKGVAVPHQGLCNLVQAQKTLFGQGPGSRVCQFASLSFDASVFEMLMALCAGATLCLGSSEQLAPGDALARFLLDERINTLTIPPSLLAYMNPADFGELKTVIVAGESCPATVMRAWAQGRRFFNAYGPTETTVWATTFEALPDAEQPLIGRPVANTRVYVLDENLGALPTGVPGELYVGGDSVTRGYWNRPGLTAERFVPDPFGGRPGARLYRTGDCARWRPDGSLEFMGRLDRQVKVRGVRIESGEIEAVLHQHPSVSQAIVVAHRPASGGSQLVAFLTVRAEDTAVDFRAYLRERLPEPMIPGRFQVLDALPLSVNGKIDQDALLKMCERLPDPTPAPVRTGVGAQLEMIWRDLLGREQIGTEDFFELGGHSLLATQLIARIRQVFKCELPLRAVFESPTIEELAVRIESA